MSDNSNRLVNNPFVKGSKMSGEKVAKTASFNKKRREQIKRARDRRESRMRLQSLKSKEPREPIEQSESKEPREPIEQSEPRKTLVSKDYFKSLFKDKYDWKTDPIEYITKICNKEDKNQKEMDDCLIWGDELISLLKDDLENEKEYKEELNTYIQKLDKIVEEAFQNYSNLQRQTASGKNKKKRNTYRSKKKRHNTKSKKNKKKKVNRKSKKKAKNSKKTK
tara:strand:- start:6090 stop:6755 length:666 start_codon:yes stop_codon:yes gene_type:complete